MTNFENIQNMSKRELASLIYDFIFLCEDDCENCPFYYVSFDFEECNRETQTKMIYKWLDDEV